MSVKHFVEEKPRIRGRLWMRVRQAYLSAHPLCVICERKNIVKAAIRIDRIVPLFKGGEDKWENYQGLCVECHKEKLAFDLNKF